MASLTLDECDELLNTVTTALKMSNFRNDYEALNAFESNLERIKAVREALQPFSGQRITSMSHRCDDLERDWNKRHFSQPKATVSQASAFGGEWIQELQAEDEVDEMEELTANQATKRKQKSKGKRHKGQAGVDLTDAHTFQRDTKAEKIGMERGSSLCHLVQPNSTLELDQEILDEVNTAKPSRHKEGTLPKHRNNNDDDDELEFPASPLEGKTIETHQYCLSSAIPLAVVAQTTPCQVVPLKNTAFAELQFDKRLELPAYEEGKVVYHVQMFRAVIAAVAGGPPKTTEPLIPSRSPVARTQVMPIPSNPSASNEASDDEQECVVSSESEDDDGDAAKRNRRVWKKMGSEEFEVLNDLSAQVVAEYDAQEEDDTFTTTKEFPRFINAPLDYIRNISTATWVILMCHGGYFAGAVYVNTKPVLHKSFHRYVVRKKQGGKQSNHEKGGGSSNSAGGLIRKGQEIKWKVAVRDILCLWREHIERAWIVLYAAPGPDNRAILTDFSLLPASTSNGVREKSPIDLKDPRVKSVPMTTHRPTFNEVERVFETVSKCTIRVKAALEPLAGSD